MKTLEYVKEHIKEIEHDNFLDRRFTKRLLDFLPAEEWKEYGFTPSENFKADEYKPKDWTEENVLEQLKEDLAFGIEKAVNHRGISASLIYEVVRSWCYILENGLENTSYGWYGCNLFEAVDDYYKWNLVGDQFDDEFYEEW